MNPYVQPELDFGKIPLTLDSIEKVQWVEHQPSNNLNSDIIDIVIPACDDYIDLSRSTLRVNFTAVDSANIDPTTPLVAGDATIIQNTLTSLWKQIEVYLNGVLISPNTIDIAYKGFINQMMDYDYIAFSHSKQMRLQNCYSSKYTAATHGDEYNNAGAPMEGVLMIDILNTLKKILINGVEIQIRLTRNSDAFLYESLVAGVVPALTLTKVSMNVCKITPKPQVLLAQNLSIAQSPFIYPFRKDEIQTFFLPQGSTSYDTEQLFNNLIPDRIFILLETSAAYVGDMTTLAKKPSGFSTNIESIEVYLDNEVIMTKKIKTKGTGAISATVNDSQKNKVLNYAAMQKDHRNFGYSAFENVYIYDILGGIDTKSLRPVKKGNIKIHVTTSNLSEDHVLIVMGQRNTFFQIDAARNVY